MGDQWFLVFDEYKFHVYIAVKTKDHHAIRIDWHQDSTVTFKPYSYKEGETELFVGIETFCSSCLERVLMKEIIGNQLYSLFDFNCRTVSYLILTDIVGFDPDEVYDLFKDSGVLCGLDKIQCVSLEEIYHYIRYREGEHHQRRDNVI